MTMMLRLTVLVSVGRFLSLHPDRDRIPAIQSAEYGGATTQKRATHHHNKYLNAIAGYWILIQVRDLRLC
jgi:hypothetical protein